MEKMPKIEIKPEYTVFRYAVSCPHCGKPIIIEGNPGKSYLQEVSKEIEADKKKKPK